MRVTSLEEEALAVIVDPFAADVSKEIDYGLQVRAACCVCSG